MSEDFYFTIHGFVLEKSEKIMPLQKGLFFEILQEL
jgi:hypothetical protein